VTRPAIIPQPKQKTGPQTISLTEVVLENNKTQIVADNEDEDVDVVNDSLTDDGNVVLLNTCVPLEAGSNYVMVTPDSFPQLKETTPAGAGASATGNKTMTINSSSLRLVSANGVSASNLLPVNTLAMLGPGVFPIYLDTQVQPGHIIADKEKGDIVLGSMKSDGELNLRVQTKSA